MILNQPVAVSQPDQSGCRQDAGLAHLVGWASDSI
jgi:hypothetical protein